MHELVHVSIDRCLFPDESEMANSQMHVFGDASKEAYATFIYIRKTYCSGRILIRII